MGFKCGLLGLPNVGKSTLFNALTDSGAAQAANYPFCTIEPNLGLVAVPDPRLTQLTALVAPERSIAAQMQFLDIAGLVANAAQGEGLGNQFLGHVRQVQAIVHVVRCFADDSVIHVSGSVDPVRDAQTIETELRLSDLQMLEKAAQRLQKVAKSGRKEEKLALERVQALLDCVSNEHPLSEWSEALRHSEEASELLITKPMIYLGNLADPSEANGKEALALAAYAKAQSRPCLTLCAKIEEELVGLAIDEKQELLEELGLAEPGLHQLIRLGYQCLGLETFFTAGKKEVRAWTIPVGSEAQMAAGVIHSDFVKHFIRAEVVAFDDYMRCQGEQGAKDQGLWRLEGREYIVQNGDVIYFRTSC